MTAVLLAAAPADPPRTLVQIDAVGADALLALYALAIYAGLVLMLLVAIFVVLVGRR